MQNCKYVDVPYNKTASIIYMGAGVIKTGFSFHSHLQHCLNLMSANLSMSTNDVNVNVKRMTPKSTVNENKEHTVYL